MRWQKEVQRTVKVRNYNTLHKEVKYISTFASRKPKANSPLRDRNSACNEISAFTQATHGAQKTYESRMVKIDTQIDKFKTYIELHLKKSKTQRQLQADIQTKKSQDSIDQLQNTMKHLIQISLKQNVQNTTADDGSNISIKSNKTTNSNKGNKSDNTTGSKAKRKRNTELLAERKKRKAKNLLIKIKIYTK